MPADDLISLADVLRDIHTHVPNANQQMDRSALNRFVMEKSGAIRKWLGGELTHPQYPAGALPAFRWLGEQYVSKDIKPGMLAIVVQDLPRLAVPDGTLPPPGDGGGDGEGENENLPMLPNERALRAFISTLGGEMSGQLAEALVARIIEAKLLPSPEERAKSREDRFLTREQAAELLSCDVSAVRRRVRPVMPGTWSFLMIQEFMAERRRLVDERSKRPRRKQTGTAVETAVEGDQ